MKTGEALGGFKVNPPNSKGVGIAGREAMGLGGALAAFHPASSFSLCNAPASIFALSMRPCTSVDCVTELLVLVSDQCLQILDALRPRGEGGNSKPLHPLI